MEGGVPPPPPCHFAHATAGYQRLAICDPDSFFAFLEYPPDQMQVKLASVLI